MGPPLETSIDSVTRACVARALGPSQWESLVRQAAASLLLSATGLEEQVCNALLGQLVLPGPPPTISSYLRHSVGLKSSPSGSKTLLRPGYLARRALLFCVSPAVDVALTVVNDAVHSSPDSPIYAATTSEDILDAIKQGSALIETQCAGKLSTHSPTLAYVQLLFARPPMSISADGLAERKVDEALTALRRALDALASSEDDALFREQLHLTLHGVAKLLDKTPQEIAPPPIDLNEATSFPDPDVAFLMADLLYRSSESCGISNHSVAVARMTAILRSRVSESSARGSTASNSLSSAFLEILLSATGELRKGQYKSVLHESFCFAKLPVVLRAIFVKGGLLDESTSDDLQACLESALRKFKTILTPAEIMEVEGSLQNEILNQLLTALCRQELISVDVAASVGYGLHPEELQPQNAIDFYSQFAHGGDPEVIRGVLASLTTDFGSQGAIVVALQQARLPLLSCDLRVLIPGDGHPIGPYGTVVLFLQVVVSRYDLARRLGHHLGSYEGFFCRWIPSISAVYSLSDMSAESKSVVDGWISDLFGEGISDDLLQSTKPHLLLRVAPTIVKQFLAAFQAGVIDLDSLRDACAYFHQDLLSFTLPGVIHWLVGEIHRTPPSSAHNAMNEILQVFIFAEALPRAVLELVSSDLSPFLHSATPEPAVPFDNARLKLLLAPYCSILPPVKTQKSPTWLHQLQADLTASIDSPATIRPNLSVSLSKALLSTPISDVVSGVVERLLSLARRLPLSFDEDAERRASRIRRAAAIFGAPGSDGHQTWPLLTCLMDDLAPDVINSLAAAPAPSTRSAEARIKNFADLLSSATLAAFWLANESESVVRGAQVEKTVDRFAAVVLSARRKVGASQGAADGKALEFFVDRFLQAGPAVLGSRSWS